jgi:hypothetical protein
MFPFERIHHQDDSLIQLSHAAVFHIRSVLVARDEVVVGLRGHLSEPRSQVVDPRLPHRRQYLADAGPLEDGREHPTKVVGGWAQSRTPGQPQSSEQTRAAQGALASRREPHAVCPAATAYFFATGSGWFGQQWQLPGQLQQA